MNYRNREIKRKERIRYRIRSKISGNSSRPRLCLSKSNRHLYAQIIDDSCHRSLLLISTTSNKWKTEYSQSMTMLQKAEALGELVGERALGIDVSCVMFDRAGYLYHGVTKAFAESVRKKGVKF